MWAMYSRIQLQRPKGCLLGLVTRLLFLEVFLFGWDGKWARCLGYIGELAWLWAKVLVWGKG